MASKTPRATSPAFLGNPPREGRSPEAVPKDIRARCREESSLPSAHPRNPPSNPRPAVCPADQRYDRSKRIDDATKNLGGPLERGQLVLLEVAERVLERVHTSRAALSHERLPLRGGADAREALVAGIGLARDEALGLERAHDARHRRRSHALGLRELAERDRSAKYDHRQRGEPRG